MRTRWILAGILATAWMAPPGFAGVGECLENSDCDDGNPCTADTCVGRPRTCSHTPRTNGTACNDGNPCTASDHCTNGVCHGTAATGPSCNDGDACTLNDHCVSGVCRGSLCDDGNACTVGSCVNGFCRFELLDCHSNACVTASCDPSSGCVFTERDCDDHNVCTNDFCGNDPFGGGFGCFYITVSDRLCDDGNVCTTDDACSFGTCVGAPRVCDDDNACTSDTCDEASGCVFTNNHGPCDDEDACTIDDICFGGSCIPGPPLDCNDDNVCTDDSCDASVGCVNADNSHPCDDDNACTLNDTCAHGMCGEQMSGLDEWQLLHDCYGGVGLQVDFTCGCFDLDVDGDVDLLDVADFLLEFGPE